MEKPKFNIAKALAKIPLVPEWKLLEFYPPFLFMGMKVTYMAEDHRKMKVKVPLRWYARNMHGSMFGGIICAIADPLPALLLAKQFQEVEVWTKKNCVTFDRPARGTLTAEIILTEEDVNVVRQALEEKGKTVRTFRFSFRDEKGRPIAQAENDVYIRYRHGKKEVHGQADGPV